MNSFTDAFFSILLSWVRSLTNAAWTAFRSGGQQGILSWLADHWLGLLILATFTGLALDWIVWMLRWRPYRLWFSGLRRRRAPWKGSDGAESTPVYGEAYEDDAMESAPEAGVYPADAAYEAESAAQPGEAGVFDASDAPHAAYAPPARWKGSPMPPDSDGDGAETPDDGWTPEGPAEEAREAYWPTQANADWTDDAWAAQNETPDEMHSEEMPDEMPEELPEETPVGAMPVERPLVPESHVDPAPDAPAYGRPGLWPGLAWARPKPREEEALPQSRRRRSARWQPQADVPENPAPSDWPAEEIPVEEIPTAEMPDEAVLPQEAEATETSAAYWEDAFEQEAEEFPEADPYEADEPFEQEQPSNRRKRSSFRSDIIRTVTGAPAKRRGIMRLSESQDEAISGLPPLMAREDAYHQPALPKKRKDKSK